MKSTSDEAGQWRKQVDALRSCRQERVQDEGIGAHTGLTNMPEDNSETLLTGSVVDQAGLHGLPKKVRNLSMPLLSVIYVLPGLAKTQETEQ